MKQYYHDMEYNNKGGTTIAIESDLTCQNLYDNLINGNSIVIKVGVAHCSPVDNYCRKTGRDIADSRLKEVEFKARYLTVIPNVRHVIMLHSIGNSTEQYILKFRLKPGALTPFFIGGDFTKYD